MNPQLVIRREQIEVLARRGLAHFIERALQHGRQYCGPQYVDLDDAALRDRVERAVQRALRYGLATERDLLRFVTLDLVFGAAFDGEPWAADILAAPQSAAWKTSRLQAAALRQRALQSAGDDGDG